MPGVGETVVSGPVAAAGPLATGVVGVVVLVLTVVGVVPFGVVGVVVGDENASRLTLGPGIPEKS